MTKHDTTRFASKTCTTDSGTKLIYHVYPPDQDSFDRVIVYIHGLVSDLSWFQVPENLPANTGILFLPRQPREHAERFELWRNHYECCIDDFKKIHRSGCCHLVAQCFGTMPGMHLAITRPETFDTITLACPPVQLQREFSVPKKLGILFGAAKGDVFCELTPRAYGRSPALKQFIDDNSNVTWKFTNQFYRQTNRLRRWLSKFAITFPAPTHMIVATEDEVAKPNPLQTPGERREMPDRTTVIQSDHFCELLPARNMFWDSVFDFQLHNEPDFRIDGDIQTVLVTGGTGFVGTPVVRRLHAAGHRVIVFSTSAEKVKEHFHDLDSVEAREGNLVNLESIRQALDGVDAVIHIAGYVSDWDTYSAFEAVNVHGTQNLLFLSHESGIKQFLHVSSLGVFGDTDQDNIDENRMYRLSSDYYSNSKIHAEIAVRKYCRQHHIPFSIVRPGFVYGDGDRKFLPRLVQRLKDGKFSYVGSPDNYVNTVYVDNVAELIDAIVGNQNSYGETYNISDPQPTTIRQFVDRVCEGLDIPKPTKVMNKRVSLGAAAVFETIFRALRLKKAPPVTRKQVTFVARSRSVNASKAWKLIGHEPHSFDEGISRTIEQLKAT